MRFLFIFDCLIIRIRFPKDETIAKQWNIAIGIDTNKIARGLVCFEHFEDRHFKGKKNKILNSDAVPTIFKTQELADSENGNQSAQIAIAKTANLAYTIAIATPSSTIATADTTKSAHRQIVSQCIECDSKDRIIDTKDAQIRILRKSLKEAQKKMWYLEKSKNKLNSALSELREKKVVDENLCKSLEV